MAQVNDDAESIIITACHGVQNAVLIGQAEYDNLTENAHLHRSWAELKAGKGGERD